MSFTAPGPTESSSQTKPWGRKLNPLFYGQIAPLASNLAQGYDPSGGPLRSEGDQEISNTVQGDYLDPSTNPALADVIGNVQRLGSQQFNQNLATINDSANGDGTLLSTRNGVAQDQAARQSAADVSGQVANLLSTNYQQERQLQSQAGQGALQASQYNQNQLMNFLSMLKGTASSSGSKGLSSGGSSYSYGGNYGQS